MISKRLIGLALTMGLAAAPAFAATGYLDPAHRPDATSFILPPPAPGSAEAKADAKAFKVTRRLQGSERWKLAIHDDIYDAPVVLGDFGCAMGVRLDASNAPRLLALVEKLQADSSAVVRTAKGLYKRPRPLVGNHAPICLDRKDFAGSFSYPSGHGSMIGAVSLVLAELAPDRAGPIAARARAFAESRVVCGVHWPSDVTTGAQAGTVLVAALHADPAFRADMEAARAEVAAARASAPAADAGQCLIENAAAAKRPW
jgi:acid phosphatase (class A)